MVVVATTLVREARSKSVEGWTGKSPPFGGIGRLDVRNPHFSQRTREMGHPLLFRSYVKRAQGFEGYQVALVGYGYRRCGEGLLVYCFLQNGEGLGEDLVLMVELLERRG